jgi:hypothetical protein
MTADLTRRLLPFGAIGVAIGNPTDKKTWRIDFAPGTTKADKTAAQEALASYDLAASDSVLAQIDALEAQQTPRRLREAVTTTAGKAWLKTLDEQIAALRASLA